MHYLAQILVVELEQITFVLLVVKRLISYLKRVDIDEVMLSIPLNVL